MGGSELFVGVLIGNHGIDRGKDRLGPVNTTEESGIFDSAPEKEGRTLICRQPIEFSGAHLDRVSGLFIVDRARQLGLTDPSRLGRELDGNLASQDPLTFHQPFGFERFSYGVTMTEKFGRLDYRVRRPGGLAMGFYPVMIEPAAGHNFAPVIVPFLLFKPGSHRTAVIDESNFSLDRHASGVPFVDRG